MLPTTVGSKSTVMRLLNSKIDGVKKMESISRLSNSLNQKRSNDEAEE